jgi:hypothetical protein
MSFLKVLLLIAFITVSALSYMGPIIEWDFFWHLNSGKAFLEGEDIPLGQFPTQWLGQAILYLAWKVVGYKGIVFLRSGVYSAILLFLYFWMRRAGVQFFVCVFFLLFPARIFLSFPSERPQLFSFLLFPLTVYLLEAFRKKERTGSVWLLPVLLALWANVHGGVLAGFACVFVYFLAEAVRFLGKKSTLGKLSTIGAVALAPVMVAALLEPKSVLTMMETALSLFAPGAYMASVMEYLPPHVVAMGLGQYYPSYWSFLAIAIVTVIVGIRRVPLQHLLLVLLFVALSLRSLRFMPFLLMLAPLVAPLFPARKGNWENSKTLFAGFTAVLCIWLILSPVKVRPGIGGEFPEGAVKFIQRMLPSGNIFNYHGWAGFILWELGGRKVFMPAQGVTKEKDDIYEAVVWAEDAAVLGKPRWNALLNAYGIEIIIMPGISPVSGEFYPVIDSLLAAGDWFLVYSDDVANIFVRDAPRNYRAISLYSLPKANAYYQIVEQAKRRLDDEPGETAFWRSLGDAYRKLGRFEDAEEAYRKGGVNS